MKAARCAGAEALPGEEHSDQQGAAGTAGIADERGLSQGDQSLCCPQ